MALRKRTKVSRLSKAKYFKPNIKAVPDEFMGKGQKESPVQVVKSAEDGNDVSFATTKETNKPYDGVVDLAADTFEQPEVYDLGLAENPGGLSKTTGGEIVSTIKVVRSRFGVIMSTPALANINDPFVVPNIKHVFEAKSYIDTIDTTITQLRKVPKEITKPKTPPVIETIQCYPGFGTLDGTWSDGFSIQILPEIGEPSLQIAANHTIVIMSRAFSYRNELGARIATGLTYKWTFTAEGVGNAKSTVVGTKPILRIVNAQLQQRGRYTLSVSNEKGATSSKSYFVNVLGGLLKELEPTTIGEEASETVIYIPTGNYVRDDNHDDNFSKYDSFFDYIESERRWIKLDWSNGAWIEDAGAAIQSPGSSMGEEDSPVQRIDGDISTAPKVTKTVGGRYWKRADNDAVWFDAPGGVSYKFSTPEEYFAHRTLRGLPADWSQIDIIEGT